MENAVNMRSFQGFSAPRSRLLWFTNRRRMRNSSEQGSTLSQSSKRRFLLWSHVTLEFAWTHRDCYLEWKQKNKQSWELHRNLVQTWLFSEAVLQTFGQCPLTWGHNRPKGLFWHHTQDMEHIYSQSKTKDLILKWITVQTDTPRQPPGFNSRLRQNTAQSLQTRELRATITSW